MEKNPQVAWDHWFHKMRFDFLFVFYFLISVPSFALLPLITNDDTGSSTVILVSMDGFRSDYWEKTETPRFHELMKRGVLASNMKPVFPSVTFVNHFTLVTGLFAENHGIVNNSMWDPLLDRNFDIRDSKEADRSEWWEGEPIWVTAEKQGVKTASMFWVSSSAEIKGKRPSYWQPYDASLPRKKRVETVLSWLDLPKEARPQLITLYFEDTDEAGHRYGPDSKEVIQAIKNLDDAIGLLIDGIKLRGVEKETTLILVSDHGMASVERGHRINLKNYVLATEAKIVGKGAVSLVWPNGKVEERKILERVKKNPGAFAVYSKQNMPVRYHFAKHRRISPLVFSANQGWYLEDSLLPSVKPTIFGLHGYDNSLPQMQAVFLAAGPKFPEGTRVGEVQNVDIYSLLAHLLNIKAEKTDGDFARISNLLGLQ